MKNLKIAYRLGIGFALIVLLFVAGAVFVKTQLGSLTVGIEKLNTIAFPRNVAIGGLLDSVNEGRVQVRNVVLAPDEASLDKHNALLDEALGHFRASLKDLDDSIAEHGAFDEEKVHVARLREAYTGWEKNLLEVRDLRVKGDAAGAMVVLTTGQGAVLGRNLSDALRAFAKYNVDVNVQLNGVRLEEARSIEHAVLIVAVLSVLVALVAGFFVSRSITRPLDEAVDSLERIAAGDLSECIETDAANHEIARLNNAMARTIDGLSGTLRTVHGSASRLIGAASGLNAASRTVREGSEQQSGAATAMAAAMEEISTSINHISDLSREAQGLSQQSGQQARSGADVIHAMVSEIGKISATVGQAAGTAESLGAEAAKITAIINVIKDIADQTNLLALNAAIEAARAGELGRGFAVVADEVRKLAEKTTASTADITAMIGAIQSGASNMASQMQQTVSQVTEGMEMARHAGGAIGQINTSTDNVVGMIDDVSRGLAEQAIASHDIANSVERIVQMVDQNADATRSVAEAAGELDSLAQSLEAEVKRFKLAH
ncbi:methyl-accepting chemotaxis protein [Crenobacter cavernae]|uniref:Methyl-accepting chemotaxis protein n=1 Tax=Crenobacter cavernae TaxID=2290923 RepID=A0ABY0FDF6_9NEIS|nr:methyl-accepting chemotaxis protein [Crenobacter cavernae]RXZ44134.1 methyl-accepting chemotaxis protein [Crenobacter cavernae]